MTDRFVATARAVAAANGLKDYPFAVIAHPIADNDDERLREKARAAVAAIVPLLTRR
jgi:alkanesulfonate monooxygenase SsuD/methylene tetrahydromethanopterin reductase-like flavin-dependent oxidoreductase (luciferase family)